MSVGLKVLIGLACVAIVAFVSYFFWKEYQTKKEQEILAEMRMCDIMLRDLKSKDLSQDWRMIHVVSCLEKHYLREKDFKEAGLTDLLNEALPLMNHP